MPEHTLYMNAASAPCRAVLLHHHLVRDAFGDLECVPVDLAARAYSPDFVRSNPLHTVPTLVTPWGAIWESRAILRYMESMLPEPRLYPSGVYARAVVDRLLDWDLGTLYRAVSTIVYPWIFGDGLPPRGEDLDKLLVAMRFLDHEQLGDGRPFLCGPSVSIADISIEMTLSLLRLVDLDTDDFSHVLAWKNRMAEIDGYADIDAPFQQWVNQVHVDRSRAAAQQFAMSEEQSTVHHGGGGDGGSSHTTAVGGGGGGGDGGSSHTTAVAVDEAPTLSALERASAELATMGGASEGERNQWTQLVACIGYDFGVDVGVWTSEVHAWNEKSNMPPLPREEVETIVRQSYKAKREQHAGGTTPQTAAVAESAPPP